MRKYGESKTTRIMMATVPHVTSGLGLRKFQANGFLLTGVYSSVEPGGSGTRELIVGEPDLSEMGCEGERMIELADDCVWC
jgi:hypothetical protein